MPAWLLRRILVFCLFVAAGRGVYGQGSASVEAARLLQKQQPVNSTVNVTADGTALPDTGESTDDDSFGAQQILKEQERRRAWQVFGNESVIFTNNVALTRSGTMSDGFFTAGGGISWTPKINQPFEVQFVTSASTFQYFETSELDFTNLGAGVGISYIFPKRPSLSAFGRYDFIELIDDHGHEILSDHEFTVGLQNIFVLGRSHSLTLGVLASAGISDPFSEQRDQLSAFIGYHLNLTRALSGDLLYRVSGHYYNDGGRSEINNVVTLTLHYQLGEYAEIAAFLSYGNNRSDHASFDYDVFTGGGGVGFNIKF